MADPTPLFSQHYEIVSVEPVDAPKGAEGNDWHRYEIAQGTNSIEGHRQGKLKAVTKAVEEIVVLLIERRSGKRGRVNLVPTPNKSK